MKRFEQPVEARVPACGLMLRAPKGMPGTEAFRAKANMCGTLLCGRMEVAMRSEIETLLGNVDSMGLTADALCRVLVRAVPAVRPQIAQELSQSLADAASEQLRAGKNESVVRGMLAKMLVWLCRDVVKTVKALGSTNAPSVLAEDLTGKHELLLLKILAGAGADVLVTYDPTRPVPASVTESTQPAEPRNAPAIPVVDPMCADAPAAPKLTLGNVPKTETAAPKLTLGNVPKTETTAPKLTLGNVPKTETTAPKLTLGNVPTTERPAPRLTLDYGDHVPQSEHTAPKLTLNYGNARTEPSAPKLTLDYGTPSAPSAPKLTLGGQPAPSAGGVIFPDPSAAQNAANIPQTQNGGVRFPSAPTDTLVAPTAPAMAGTVNGKLYRLANGTVSPYVSALSAPDLCDDERFGPALTRYLRRPARMNVTNTWCGVVERDTALMSVAERGARHGTYNNILYRENGAYDKLTYTRELVAFRDRLTETGRKPLIIEGTLPKAEPQEIAAIRFRPYKTLNELIIGLSVALRDPKDEAMSEQLVRAFAEVVTRMYLVEKDLNRVRTAAVCLIALLNRYAGRLFGARRNENDIAVCLKLGGCRDDMEAMFFAALALLPVDVLIFAPDLDCPCVLDVPFLAQRSYSESLILDRFPESGGVARLRTAAAEAHTELGSLLSTSGGTYSGGLEHADSVVLTTTREELDGMWTRELRLRPGFNIANGRVTMPVLCARVTGMPASKDPYAYWREIAARRAQGTMLYTRLPIGEGHEDYMKMAVSAMRGNVLNRDVLRADPRYPFAQLRRETEEHLLDKLKYMLEHRTVRGTFVNGMEHRVVAAVLSIDKQWLRALQDFDFARMNPKLVIVIPGEERFSVEDAARIAFASLVGFDVLLYVPTGYRNVENLLNGFEPTEHRVGAYVYDAAVPDLDALPPEGVLSKLGRYLRRN